MPQSLCATIGRKTIDLFSTLRHWNLRNLTLQQECYLTSTQDFFRNTHGSIMLPPRQPRVFARLGSLAINAPVNHVCHWIVSLLIPYWFQSQNSYIYFESKYFLNWSDNAADVIFTILAKISVASQAQCYAIFMVGKSDQNKRNDWKICVPQTTVSSHIC